MPASAPLTHSRFALLLLAVCLSACQGGRVSLDASSRGDAGPDSRDTESDSAPILGSLRARHPWASFCASNPDSASLPVDPRSTVQPGRNEGRAVFFNAWYEDCHVNIPDYAPRPQTCGEWKAQRDKGLDFLLNELPVGSMSAEDFDNSWQTWGYSERPDNFEELYTLRYGLNFAPFHNPYPLPGEDPNATNGGSGQLPLGLRQNKDENGNWTGTIGTAACFQCHGGQVGDPYAGEQVAGIKNLGLGNNNFDTPMNGRDNSPTSGTLFGDVLPPFDANTIFNIGIKQRGQNNAVGAFELLVTLLDVDSLGLNPNPLKMFIGPNAVVDASHPLAHTQDTPPWWNMGFRPRKFFDAGVSNDSIRIIMAAGTPEEFEDIIAGGGKVYRDRIQEYARSLESFFLSLESPAYPESIDESLATQGAILFHSKDLWASPVNVNAPKPLGGNGSCASCHGVYSPYFAQQDQFLEDPSLIGVAGHISPLDVIGTDPARSDMLTSTMREQWDTTYWGYIDNTPGYVAPEDKDPVTELLDDMSPNRPEGVCGWQKDVIGYQAPPLHGVWATAPYFHNGSVPTIEQVLDSTQRPAIWRRQLQTDGEVTGFDQRLSVAYDFDSLGWKHDALRCDEMPGTLLFNCNPVQDEGPSIVQIAENMLHQAFYLSGLVTVQDPAADAYEKRLIFDSRILGNGNQGHSFSDALNAQERRAVIEYLKTL